MKKSLIIALLLGILLCLPLVQAQAYSGFDRFTDDIRLFFYSEANKVKLALEIREKEINSAIENYEKGNTETTAKNLERAQSKLQIVQEKISLETAEEVKKSVEDVTNKINDKDGLPEEFDAYLLEEEKTGLTAELTLKTFEYCTELAKEGYEGMLKEEVCNPDTAAPGLEKELRELKDLQMRMFVQLMLNVRSCIDDPGTCNCDEVLDIKQKAKCEKMVALAVKCEYKEDETSCRELKAMEPVPGDNFAKSFIPDFLINLFREKRDMIEYNLTHSDGVPEECWDDNDKPECEKYASLKETRLDWDEYGNFIGTNRAKGIPEPIPTIEESVPECYDEGGNFLEEKCGKITVIWTEEGLINYIVEKQIDDIVNDFTNKSEQHAIDVNGTKGQNQTQDKVMEIKKEMDQINNQIVTGYAPGTGPGGDAGVVIEGGEQKVAGDSNGGVNVVDNVVVEGGNGNGGMNVVDNVVVVGDNGGGNDIAGVDEGPGEPGVVDED